MPFPKIEKWLCLPTLIFIFLGGLALSASAQSFTDPGFENYSLTPGGFIQPTNGPWLFGNDAGVTMPYAGNSSTGATFTWSATFAAVEGQQYASTYAGADRISQRVLFSTPGEYVISVYAAAPSGTVLIPPSLTPTTLGKGTFSFILNSTPLGSPYALDPGSDWARFDASFTITTPGTYTLGVQNTLIGPYFINYDNFAIEPVPEPAILGLFAMGLLALAGAKWRRGRQR